MKKAAFALIIVFLCFHSTVQAQYIDFGSRGAVCPFRWEGEIWRTDLGSVLAAEVQKRLRSDRQIYYIPMDETRRILADARMETAWNVDPDKLRDVFWKKNIRLLVTGKIEDLYLIRDVDGTAYADVKIRINIIDVFEGSLLLNDTVEYRTKASAYITAESPYDREVALSILVGGANRVVAKIRSGLDQYFRNNRMRRIY